MYKRIIRIVAIAVIAVSFATGLAVHHVHVEAQQKVADAQHAKSLADWQAKVKAWNAEQLQQKQIATTTKQSDLQQQGVSQLPDTGANNVLEVFVVGGLAAVFGHQIILRRRLS